DTVALKRTKHRRDRWPPRRTGPGSVARRGSLTPPMSAVVRRPAPVGDVQRDAVTRQAGGMAPWRSREATICFALSSTDCPAVLMVSSGLSGASYGAEMPVNSLISPARAFL